MAFPSSIDSFAGFTSSHTLSQDNHASQHNSEQSGIVAVETKVGTGSSTPVNNTLLRGNGTGTSTWTQANLTSDVTGVLGTGNGGTGSASITGSGLPVFQTSPTINSPTITNETSSNANLTGQPTISDFTNAQHNHSNVAGGGQLTGSTALTNSSVTADKLNTGAKSATVSTDETTTSTSYTDLATSGPAVTVTIGANGMALVSVGAQADNQTGGQAAFMSWAVSGATTVAAADIRAGNMYSNTGGQVGGVGAAFLQTGLSPGSNTFTAKYRATGGTGEFQNRAISVIPL